MPRIEGSNGQARGSGRERANESRSDKHRRAVVVRWTAAIGIGGVLAAAIVVFFSVDVCDQQLSSKGTAVKVCRHLQASDPPVIAVALVVLAALGVFFTEISGFGFTLKREVREATKKAEEARTVGAINEERIKETAGDLAD